MPTRCTATVVSLRCSPAPGPRPAALVPSLPPPAWSSDPWARRWCGPLAGPGCGPPAEYSGSGRQASCGALAREGQGASDATVPVLLAKSRAQSAAPWGLLGWRFSHATDGTGGVAVTCVPPWTVWKYARRTRRCHVLQAWAGRGAAARREPWPPAAALLPPPGRAPRHDASASLPPPPPARP